MLDYRHNWRNAKYLILLCNCSVFPSNVVLRDEYLLCFHTEHSQLCYCGSRILERPRVTENRVKIIAGYGLISSHRALKSRKSQHSHAKAGFIQTILVHQWRFSHFALNKHAQ
jgi:hypothetical protein